MTLKKMVTYSLAAYAIGVSTILVGGFVFDRNKNNSDISRDGPNGLLGQKGGDVNKKDALSAKENGNTSDNGQSINSNSSATASANNNSTSTSSQADGSGTSAAPVASNTSNTQNASNTSLPSAGSGSSGGASTNPSTPPPSEPVNTPPPPSQPACGSAGGPCTLAEVATHNSQSNCWGAYDSGYYILTSYVSKHPGGQSVFNSTSCGSDMTGYMNGSQSVSGKRRNHSQSAYNVLASYYVGPIK